MSGQAYPVAALRKRLYRWGYTEISIERVKANCVFSDFVPREAFYFVQAVEPLAHQHISFVISESNAKDLLKKQHRKDR